MQNNYLIIGVGKGEINMHNLCESSQRLSSLSNFSQEKVSEGNWCIMKNAESHMHIFIQYVHNSNVVCDRNG